MLRRMLRRGLLAATALGVVSLAWSAGAAQASTNRALLVAVTAYPNLKKSNWLVGPNNDAVLVREYLRANKDAPFADDNITVLADGIEGAKGTPTKAAILAALADLETSKPGDFIYIHFSGHGSQQPALVQGKETDGLDEIFLPADTKMWKQGDTGVPNALLDDEIGTALDKIRATGANVWFVVDACHSGTATRDVAGPASDVRERELKPNDLGIPSEAITAAESAATGGATRGIGEQARETALTDATPNSAVATQGKLVAFYAAQTTETTPERPMPRGQEGATSYGVFTYTMFSRMAENPTMSYRQLGQAILQQYTADRQDRPTPLFEGDLDAGLFGAAVKERELQWPIKVKGSQAELAGGLLHRLAPGTKLAILPSPDAAMADAVGYLEVTSAKNLSSEARPVKFEGKEAVALSAIPPNAYARLTELAVNFKLTVARPAPNDKLAEQVAMVNAALDQLAANPEKRFNIELVDAGADADLRLAVTRENEIEGAAMDAADTPALWFLPPSGEMSATEGGKPPLIAIDLANPEKLSKAAAENLQKIFRATNLARLSVASGDKLKDVTVSFMVKREGGDGMQPLDASAVPYVNPGDQVHIVAENKSNKRVDINVLYIGSNYSISHMRKERLEAGAKLEDGILQFTDESFGMEQMIAVLTEAPAGSEIEDLSFLQQGGVRAATRGAGGQFALSEMLTQIAEPPATRAAQPFKVNGATGPSGAVMIFQLETQPRKN